MARDLYQVLGVARDASEADIKKAYRKLAMEYHPDRNNGDKSAEEQFKAVTEAYDVLRDADKRARYDRFGEAGLKGAGAGAGYHPFDLSEALRVFMQDFGGMGGFDAFFGGGERERRQRSQGRDIRLTLQLTLVDVAKGATKKVKVRRLERCVRCEGQGAEPGTKSSVCRTCGGSGEVRRAAQSLFGQFISVTPCPTCRGEGSVISKSCSECRGEGRVRADRVLDVEVPPGVSSNNYLTLRGQGEAGLRGGPTGDLLISLEIAEDTRFERHGDDLLYDLPISFSQAVFGGEFTVPLPEGTLTAKVPAGIQSGSIVTVRGKGLPSVGNGRRGDLHLRIQVWTPTDLSKDQEGLFRELSKHETRPPQDEGVGRRIWNRMKETLGD